MPDSSPPRVDQQAGDGASKTAYAHAQSTFAARDRAAVGRPVPAAGGFSGLIDMGDYYLTQNDDGIGTKVLIAEQLSRFDTVGFDLLAMVADDAVTCGAEVISITNALDVPSVHNEQIDQLVSGLARACRSQQIAITGGEIAEVPDLVSHIVWNATAVGVVAKDRLLNPSSVQTGDTIIALREEGVRSNGLTRARGILEEIHGNQWIEAPFHDTTWGEALLTPSRIYHASVLALLGRYGEKQAVPVRAIAHITGGGIPGNLRRILPERLGAHLTHLWEPPPMLTELVRLGSLSQQEAYETWGMGNGMLLVTGPSHADEAVALLREHGEAARVAGEVTDDGRMVIEGNEW